MTLPASMIGRLGQTALQAWASQVCITSNPSFHDERGWDAFLQISLDQEDEDTAPLDKLPPEISCMVQVKASLSADTSEPINLLNWRRMCTDPIPWFVLAIRIDSQTQVPAEAHLIHVGETWCAKVLKRLRELGS